MAKDIMQWCVYVLVFLGLLIGVYTDIKERKIVSWVYILELPVLLGLNFLLGKMNLIWGITIIGTFCLFYAISVLTKEQFGKGDVIVITMTGAGLGILQNMMVLYVAFLLAFIFSVLLLVLKKANKKTALPFVPFLFVSYIMQMVCICWNGRG